MPAKVSLADCLPADLPAFINLPTISEHTSLSRSVLREMVRRGQLPPPVVINPRVWKFHTQSVREALGRLKAGGVA